MKDLVKGIAEEYRFVDDKIMDSIIIATPHEIMRSPSVTAHSAQCTMLKSISFHF